MGLSPYYVEVSKNDRCQIFYKNEDLIKQIEFGARIKVVGIGGSGSNAVDYMINSGIGGVDFIVINTDAQDLHESRAKKKIHIGRHLTQGRGAGMNPEIGRRAAEETKNELQETLKDTDMVFLACGLGGGTGSGAAPIVAEIARNNGILTLAVVTMPFTFEGVQRTAIAQDGLEKLMSVVDTLIVVPNDRILDISNQKTPLHNAFALCDDVLKNAVQSISELIVKHGIINLDFADIKTVTTNAGLAMMGIGQASGEERATKAAKAAINSSLLDISIDGAKSILFSIAGGDDLTLTEVNEAAKIITASADPKAKIIFGALKDTNLSKGEIKITVIATGVSDQTPDPPFEAKEDIYGPNIGHELLFSQKEENQKMKKKSSTPIINSKEPQFVSYASNAFLESYKDKQQSSSANTSWKFFNNSEESLEKPFIQRIKKIGEVLLILFTLLVGMVALAVYSIFKAASIFVLRIKLKKRFAGRTF